MSTLSSRFISLPKIHFHRNHVAPANLSFMLASAVPFPASLRLTSSARLGVVACLKQDNTEEENVVAKSDAGTGAINKSDAGTGAMNKKIFKCFLVAMACCVTALLAKQAHLERLLMAFFDAVWNTLPTVKSQYKEYKWIIEVIKLVYGTCMFIEEKMKKKEEEENKSGSKKN